MTDDERQKLNVGDVVIVRDDAGVEAEYSVKHQPWQLGHGAWVIGLAGISGGYSLDRVVGLARPKIVCLCGSTRFWETFRDMGLKLTLEGKIVLSIGICAPDSMVLANPDTEEGKEQKAKLDQLHLRKIDLADEVLILNVGGYIGDSTRRELDHAKATGKVVRFLEEYERGVSHRS